MYREESTTERQLKAISGGEGNVLYFHNGGLTAYICLTHKSVHQIKKVNKKLMCF